MLSTDESGSIPHISDIELLLVKETASSHTKNRWFTFGGFVIATIQTMIGIIWHSYLNNRTTSFMILNGLIVAISSGLIFKWTYNNIRNQEELLDPNGVRYPRQGLCQMSAIFSACSMILGTLITFNLLLDSDFMKSFLQAQSSDQQTFVSRFGDTDLQSIATLINFQKYIYIATEAVVLVYFCWRGLNAYEFTRFPPKASSFLLAFSHAALLALGLCLSLIASQQSSHAIISHYTTNFQTLSTGGLLTAGMLISVIASIGSYLSHKQRRGKLLVLSLLIGLMSIFLIDMLISTIAYRNSLYKKYTDVESARTWSMLMSLTSKQELAQAGCPQKYLDDENCQDIYKAYPWEVGPLGIVDVTKCLNPACAGVLAGLNTENYQISINLLLLSLILIGVLLVKYRSITKNTLEVEVGDSKTNLHAILAIIGLGIVYFCLFRGSNYNFSPIKPTEIHKLGLNQFHAQYPSVESFTYSSALSSDQNEEVEELEEKLFEFLVFRLYKYLIIRFDETHVEQPYLFGYGSTTANYDELKQKLCEAQHGVGLIWMEVEHVSRLAIIKFVDDEVDERIKDIYPTDKIDETDIGFIEAQNCVDLGLENVLQEIKSTFKLYGEEKIIQINPFLPGSCNTRIQKNSLASDEYSDKLIILDTNDGFETDLITKFNDLRQKGAYKFVIGGESKDEPIVELRKEFDFCSGYPALLENLDSSYSIILYDLIFENYNSPFALIWNIDKTSPEIHRANKALVEAMKSVAIPTIQANTYENIDLDKLIGIAVISNPSKRQEITEKTSQEIAQYF